MSRLWQMIWSSVWPLASVSRCDRLHRYACPSPDSVCCLLAVSGDVGKRLRKSHPLLPEGSRHVVEGWLVACMAGPIDEVPDDSQAPLHAAPAAHQRVCRNALCGIRRHAKSHIWSDRKSMRSLTCAGGVNAGGVTRGAVCIRCRRSVALSLCRTDTCTLFSPTCKPWSALML